MDVFSKILTDNWKEIIESINIDGYSRKVESVNIFRMNNYYTGYPDIHWCYKVSFNFPVSGYEDVDRTNKKSKSDVRLEKWHKALEEKFTNVFYDRSKKPFPGSNSGETKFENSRVDYMTNQGYRFIVQFYPEGFLSDFRNEKLKLIGI